MTVYTVEDVNPNGQAVKSLEMSIKRGRMLAKLCRWALEAAEGDPRYARKLVPWVSGYGAKPSVVNFVFGEPGYAAERRYREWWPWLFDQWYNGGLERSEQDALANLPAKVRAKLSVKPGTEPDYE